MPRQPTSSTHDSRGAHTHTRIRNTVPASKGHTAYTLRTDMGKGDSHNRIRTDGRDSRTTNAGAKSAEPARSGGSCEPQCGFPEAYVRIPTLYARSRAKVPRKERAVPTPANGGCQSASARLRTPRPHALESTKLLDRPSKIVSRGQSSISWAAKGAPPDSAARTRLDC